MFLLGGFILLLFSFALAENTGVECPLRKCYSGYSGNIISSEMPTLECLTNEENIQQCITAALSDPRLCRNCDSWELRRTVSSKKFHQYSCYYRECSPLYTCFQNIQTDSSGSSSSDLFDVLKANSTPLKGYIDCIETAETNGIKIANCMAIPDQPGLTDDIITTLQAVYNGCPAEEFYNSCIIPAYALLNSYDDFCNQFTDLIDSAEVCAKRFAESKSSCAPVIPVIDRFVSLAKDYAEGDCSNRKKENDIINQCSNVSDESNGQTTEESYFKYTTEDSYFKY